MAENERIESGVDSTSVLLIDDHSLVSELVAKYLPLEGRFRVTLANTVPEGIAEIASHGAFGVVLLDVCLPERLTRERVAQVVSANEPGSVVLFSGNVSKAFVDESLEVGALGFIPKTLSLRSLASLISLVASGEPFVPAGYFSSAEQFAQATKYNLNSSELEVLEKLGKGCSNKEIMALLDLPESTVKMRVRNVARKLGAKNRTHAVIIAREEGLVV